MNTVHSIDRVLERTTIKNVREAGRFLNNAIRRGKHPDAFRTRERTWLLNRARTSEEAFVYNGYCVIADGAWVITLYKLPGWFGKTRFDGKVPIRNMRQYYRKYRDIEYDVEPAI